MSAPVGRPFELVAELHVWASTAEFDESMRRFRASMSRSELHRRGHRTAVVTGADGVSRLVVTRRARPKTGLGRLRAIAALLDFEYDPDRPFVWGQR